MSSLLQFDTSVGKTRTILVEGNIGAGKTTFLSHISRYDNVHTIPEPLEKWTNLNGFNLLERMYENPNKWSYTFQNYALLTQLENHLMISEKDVKIMERSMYSSRYCFGEALLHEKKIERESFEVYNKWFEYASKHIENQTDLIVYLRTTPEIAFQRMQRRKRTEENAVSFEYVVRLHNLHESWLFYKGYNTIETKSKIPIFIMDANMSRDCIHNEYERFEKFLSLSPLPRLSSPLFTNGG